MSDVFDRLFIPAVLCGGLALGIMGEPIGWLIAGMAIGRFV